MSIKLSHTYLTLCSSLKKQTEVWLLERQLSLKDWIVMHYLNNFLAKCISRNPCACEETLLLSLFKCVSLNSYLSKTKQNKTHTRPSPLQNRNKEPGISVLLGEHFNCMRADISSLLQPAYQLVCPFERCHL